MIRQPAGVLFFKKMIYHINMKLIGKNLPIIAEKGDDGIYVVECPVLDGCYSQGKTLDEALGNIREAISLILEEKKARETIFSYKSEEVSLHSIAV